MSIYVAKIRNIISYKRIWPHPPYKLYITYIPYIKVSPDSKKYILEVEEFCILRSASFVPSVTFVPLPTKLFSHSRGRGKPKGRKSIFHRCPGFLSFLPSSLLVLAGEPGTDPTHLLGLACPTWPQQHGRGCASKSVLAKVWYQKCLTSSFPNHLV